MLACNVSMASADKHLYILEAGLELKAHNIMLVSSEIDIFKSQFAALGP